MKNAQIEGVEQIFPRAALKDPVRKSLIQN